jgi:predicted Zn finger-like uncharacterized protein
MYTQCSSCLTLFRVTPLHLRTARGRVRCCLCNHAFDALASLSERLPPGFSAEYATQETGRSESHSGASHQRSAGAPADELSALQSTGEDGAPPMAVAVARRWNTWGWVLAILALLLLLMLQYGYAARAELARYPALRPALEQLCAVAGCQLPALRDASAIRVVDRRIVPHPRLDGALLVEATIASEAAFMQPFPELGLSLFDSAGQRTGYRWFAPEEYLPPTESVEEGMRPGRHISVRMELTEPAGGPSEGFEFRFR